MKSHENRTKTNSHRRVSTPILFPCLSSPKGRRGGGASEENGIFTSHYGLTEKRYSDLFRAGVIGLTTALVLSRGNNEDGGKRKYEITVAAKHMPGDYDVEYASPWAGANYLPLVNIL